MSAFLMAAGLMLAPAPMLAVEQVDVAFDELVASRNAAAIERIEANASLESEHPARLINLGVAYARRGEADAARRLFRQALEVTSLQLETANGEWSDSHTLARRALARLGAGERGAETRTAMR